MKTKEIIGYKLKDEKYRKAALKITDMSEFFDTCKTEVYCFEDRSHASGKVKEFGVLDLWFEPVYKEEPEKPKKGEYWFHSTGQLELIIEYVQERDTVKSLPIHTCKSKGRYSFHGVCTMDRKATDAEVEAALIQEAKKRGFKEGVEINCVEGQTSDNRGYNIGSEYDYFNNELWIDDCGKSHDYSFCVFKDGKWATVKEQPHEVIFPKHLEGKLTIKYQ